MWLTIECLLQPVQPVYAVRCMRAVAECSGLMASKTCHMWLQVLLHWVLERHFGTLVKELGPANTALLVEVGFYHAISFTHRVVASLILLPLPCIGKVTSPVFVTQCNLMSLRHAQCANMSYRCQTITLSSVYALAQHARIQARPECIHFFGNSCFN